MAYHASMKYLWFVLVVFIFPLNAEIYRWQDESGRIIYSDQFHVDAEIIKITEPASYKPLAIDNLPDVPADEDMQGYEISILSPQENEAIWANDGNLPINIDLQPKLNSKNGDRLIVSLDAMTVGEPQSSMNFTIPIIERGEHTISVSLINKAGVTLATSQTIHFQLHRASVN
ncbi:MAG: hypothetical protein COA95_03830 [Methylophaga sp.]|nr:MAG: hypothetical protein COA95_03830 [Methylophaga sp.]